MEGCGWYDAVGTVGWLGCQESVEEFSEGDGQYACVEEEEFGGAGQRG